jgi:hypothetical protein
VSKNLFFAGWERMCPWYPFRRPGKGRLAPPLLRVGPQMFCLPFFLGKSHTFSHRLLLTSAWRATSSSTRLSHEFFSLRGVPRISDYIGKTFKHRYIAT